jgi:hypothetical protein
MNFVVVTPAGREKYLRLLAHYVLGSPVVTEWHLWDNCRTLSDREYLHRLAASDPRCKLMQLPGANGGFGIIGAFFRFCDDPDAFYLRLDDDIVYVEDGLFQHMLDRATAARGSAIWFAPLIVNNAVCGSLIKNLSRVSIEGPISCQAMCPFAWAHADFPIALHPVFIEAVEKGRVSDFHVPDREVRASRFSINAIGFFGADKLALGDAFMPLGAQNEEEWLSAILPMRLNSCGKVLGDMTVAHFSYYTQEWRLLQTDILERYYALARLAPPHYEKPVDVISLKDRLRLWKRREQPDYPTYRIALTDGRTA